MLPPNKKISFINFIKLWGIIFLVALAIIIISVDLVYSFREINTRMREMRENYITQQKQLIKEKVLNVIRLIDSELKETERVTKEKIKSRVYEAIAIANNIYTRNRNVRSKNEIKKIIIDAISPIRFENGRGYFIVGNFNEKLEFLPTDSKNQKLNDKIIKQLTNIAQQQEEGFYKRSPINNNNSNKTIFFIKTFKPLNIFIASGLNTKIIQNEIEKGLLEKISRIRYGKEGYIFVNRLNGDALVSNGKVFSGNKKLWEVFNKEPQKIKDVFEKEYRAAQIPGGDYIFYSWIKLTQAEKESPKVSFIYGIPKLQWLVGTGVYLDDVEKNIATLHSNFIKRIKVKLFYLSLIITSAILGSLLLYNLFTKKLRRDLDLFISFFNKAVFANQQISTQPIRFIEFETMTKSVNKILADKSKAQKELEAEKKQLFVTIHSIGDGVITTDTQGKIVLINRVAEKLTGWRESEAKGKPLEEVFNVVKETTREKIVNPVARVLKEGKVVGLANHTILLSRDGKEYNIADSAAPIQTTDGKIIGIVLVFRDVTEKLKTDKELLKIKKLESIGTLAGGIAHDFNNILTAIFGNLELAKLELHKDHPAHTYIEIANQALDKATSLTKQLLTFSKGGEPILEAADIKPILRETVQFNLTGSKIIPEFEISDALWLVKVDKGQFGQVIANLTINAKEAMPDGGKLYVKAENIENPSEISKPLSTNRYIKIIIKDEGIGIHQNYLDKIFDPYFTTKQKGSGLGLAIVHSIITKHNGYITVNSRPAEGTSFSIYLPAEGKSRKTNKSEAPPNKTTISDIPTYNILIMDDEEMVRNVAVAMLKSIGHRVEAVSDGRKAVERYRESIENNPFDIVIMDLTVPGGMGGKEAAREILNINPEAIIIVTSGYFTDPVMAHYSKYGFKGRIVKPFRINNLKKEIMRVIQEIKEN